VDEQGFVLDILLAQSQGPEAAKTFLTRLLEEYGVPAVIHTNQLRSYGAAIREIPRLATVEHQQVIFAVRCNKIIEQPHRPTWPQERQRAGVVYGVRSAQDNSRDSGGGNVRKRF
jgi:putative transposase